MDDARQLWSWWQSLLAAFGPVFTRPGWVRFVQWVTGMVMCWEEHTITQILISLGLESRWRASRRPSPKTRRRRLTAHRHRRIECSGPELILPT